MKVNESAPFGIEIEYIGNRVDPYTLARELTQQGITTRVERYNHSTRTHWKIVHDASLGGRNAAELVSPKLYGVDGLKTVRKVMRIMRELGCSVNNTCGMHVHHDASHLDQRGLFMVGQMYNHFFPVFKGVFPVSRQSSSWASLVPSREFVEQFNTRGHINRVYFDRYEAVNYRALSAHGTLEFRQHQGSLNGFKATAWIVFTQNIMHGVQHIQKFSRRRDGDAAQLRRGLWVLLGLRKRCPHYGLDYESAKALRWIAKRNGFSVKRILTEHGQEQALEVTLPRNNSNN